MDVALDMAVPEPTFKERRGQQRIRFESPATVSAGQHTLAASTKDISSRGIFLFTDARFEEDSEVDIMLTPPEQLGLPASGMVCCHGRVVRVDSSIGPYGIAIKFDRLEVVPQV